MVLQRLRGRAAQAFLSPAGPAVRLYPGDHSGLHFIYTKPTLPNPLSHHLGPLENPARSCIEAPDQALAPYPENLAVIARDHRCDEASDGPDPRNSHD